jgi:hypothetical protein
MSDTTAKFIVEMVFLLGLIGVFWRPDVILGGAEKKALNWRMRLILKPFPEESHSLVLRIIAGLGITLLVCSWFLRP